MSNIRDAGKRRIKEKGEKMERKDRNRGENKKSGMRCEPVAQFGRCFWGSIQKRSKKRALDEVTHLSNKKGKAGGSGGKQKGREGEKNWGEEQVESHGKKEGINEEQVENALLKNRIKLNRVRVSKSFGRARPGKKNQGLGSIGPFANGEKKFYGEPRLSQKISMGRLEEVDAASVGE